MTDSDVCKAPYKQLEMYLKEIVESKFCCSFVLLTTKLVMQVMEKKLKMSRLLRHYLWLIIEYFYND